MVLPLSLLFRKRRHVAMGIVNITPNSFSDGGRFNHRRGFDARLRELQGVDVLDIGAESTAPANAPIGCHLEYQRFKQLGVSEYPWRQMVSIDTYHLETFSMLQDRFNVPIMFNDVSGHLGQSLAELLGRYPRSPYVFCYNLAPQRELTSHHMSYVYREKMTGLIDHLRRYFERGYEFWQHHHLVNPLIFDLGFGFAKTYQQNWYLLHRFAQVVEFFGPEQSWLVGISRKSFLQRKAWELGVDSEQLQRKILRSFSQRLSQNHLLFRVHDPEVLR